MVLYVRNTQQLKQCKASLFVFIGATVLLVVGIIEMGTAVWQALTPAGQAHAAESVSVRVAVIEAVDVILVATVLFLIAFGLYQLFVDRRGAYAARLAADIRDQQS